MSVHEALTTVATGPLDKFTVHFHRMRKMFPDQMAEACLWCIASRGLDPAARSMAFWLALGAKYIAVLLEPDTLPLATAAKATVAVKAVDPEFFIKLLKASRAAHPTASDPSVLEPVARPRRLQHYAPLAQAAFQSR